jgi:hypothetical protein
MLDAVTPLRKAYARVLRQTVSSKRMVTDVTAMAPPVET